MLVMLALLVGCEPGPGDVGFYDCDPFGLGPDCDAFSVELCCEQVTKADMRCAIVRGDGKEYRCHSEIDCAGAVQAAMCDVCDDLEGVPCATGEPGVRP